MDDAVLRGGARHLKISAEETKLQAVPAVCARRMAAYRIPVCVPAARQPKRSAQPVVCLLWSKEKTMSHLPSRPYGRRSSTRMCRKRGVAARNLLQTADKCRAARYGFACVPAASAYP
ncbi:hypothetical protein AB4Y43_33630 [Paraburkholderia sp. BR10872]|uniref:hypothetical protein n=1 Tax=Paraburkholderia sp. BR10872 TaxID=3236989 RepID=UPI0034D3143C